MGGMAQMTPIDLARWTLDMITSGKARELRERSELDLLAAGQQCGNVYPSTVMRWERGERLPRGHNLVTYGRFLERLTRVAA
jgi:hypothetical protein